MGNQNKIGGIKACIWQKQSYHLFDYQTNKFKEKQLEIVDGFIYFTQKNMFVQGKFNNEEYKAIACITKNKNNQFHIQQAKQIEENFISIYTDQQLWQVVNCTSKIIKQNDYIKLGRVKLHIYKVKYQDNSNLITQFIDENNQSEDNSENFKQKCRICYRSAKQNNLLMQPCNCIGSIKYIHLFCLQQWISSKISYKSTQYCQYFSWRDQNDLRCEICHSKFKVNLQSLVLRKKIIPPYIIIHSKKQKFDNVKGSMYIISLKNQKQIQIGRSHDCELRLKDVSVSRHHCSLKFFNNQIFIRDNKSKFGTLVRLQDKILINNREEQKWVQYGRILLKINYRQPQNYNIVWCCNIQNSCSQLDLNNELN